MTALGINLNFPISDPTWIFLTVLVIILFAPLLLNKLKIPHIIGMILAGILIGEHGLNILERDSSFELFGQVGLYYIMFLAGLEMDMEDFRKNKVKGLVFGLLTFCIPMLIGIWSSVSLLGYGIATAVLLASMYASHTLIAYPIVSRYGLSRQRSVTVSIGGTVVTVTLALVVLALISGLYNGSASPMYWVMLFLKVTLICLVIIFVFPWLARIFFRKYDDAVMQFVFVLAIVFLGGGLISLAGMEGILGAFLVGIAINPLIPKVSPLMNRLEFVGNALFIPYFLIGVGMIIDLRAFITSGEALKVAVVMTAVATFSKWIAAWLTQKIYRMSRNERKMIFGLSNAQAAATLAAVLVGHEIIMENGERLLNDDVLNGTVVMILITCIISTIETERAARKFALDEQSSSAEDAQPDRSRETVLIPVANPDTIENLVNLALIVKDSRKRDGIVALNVQNDGNPENSEEVGRRYLEKAAMIASAVDVKVDTVCRYDLNIASGIVHTIKERGITSVVIGLHQKSGFLDSFFGSMTGNLLKSTFCEVMVARLMMPVNTINGIVAIVPPQAEFEAGFIRWLTQLNRMLSQTGTSLKFRTVPETAISIKAAMAGLSPGSSFSVEVMEDASFLDLMDVKIKPEQLLVVVKSRPGSVSYDPVFDRLPALLNKDFSTANLMVIYPEQTERPDVMSFSDPVATA